MKQRSGSPLILNVDDNDAGRYLVSRHLKQAGYETIEAATGEEGLRLAATCQPDLILLDVRLPDIDGFEVCRRIRGNPELSGIPVLQMSASYVDTSSQIKGLENGADGYLTEPTEPAFLAATINSLLRMKRAEQRVGLAARQWQTTFDAVQDGLALLDPQGIVLQANRSYTAVFGPERLCPMVQRLLERLRSSGERVGAEETLGGHTVSITMDRVLDDTGQLSGAVCTVSDITARKRFESHLNQSQRLESIGVLAGGIAHDFNNLLTGILGNASVLVEMLPEVHPANGIASEIMKVSESAALLTRQILAYAGKGKTVTEPVDLSEAVLENVSLVHRFVPKSVELICETDPQLPQIHADPSQMQQVIMNLIINAAESFGERKRGSITVRTARESLAPGFFLPGDANSHAGAYVSLTVTDTGCGMDEATQARIFEPFFTSKFLGRGLGLSAVHGIISGHKGVLRLRSALGQGTTFQAYFPAVKKKIAAPSRAAEEKAQKGSGTVLVIDDESAVRNFVRVALEKLGYRVLTAEDGRMGVELFRARHAEITLVLLDLSMPVMDGELALEQIRLVSPSAPVILSSGLTEAVAAERFKGKKVSGFLPKPYTTKQIGMAIEKALAHMPRAGAWEADEAAAAD